MTNAEKLTQWIAANGIKRAWFADQVPCSRSALGGWCAGRFVPPPIYAGRIEDLTKGEIKAGEW